MTNDPNKFDQNKKENQSNDAGGQSGQQQDKKRQSGQRHDNLNDSSQKRPTEGGTDVERDQQKADRTGQRKAS